MPTSSSQPDLDRVGGAEFGSIERELHVDAAPEVVYEVITTPEHLREWWPDEAELDPTPGAVGHLVFGDRAAGTAHVPTITVVEAEPPHRFSFRWVQPDGEAAVPGNSLLVTFDLVADGAGTRVRMTEAGFRDRGWEVAVLEEHYRDHVSGWDHFLPQLVEYAARVGAAG